MIASPCTTRRGPHDVEKHTQNPRRGQPGGLPKKDGAIALSGAGSVDTATTWPSKTSRTKNLVIEYKVFLLPSTVFIHPSGTVAAVHLGAMTPAQIEQYLLAILPRPE